MSFSATAIAAALKRPTNPHPVGEERALARWASLLAEPFLDFAGMRDGEDVLDVGCGAGRLSLRVVTQNTLRSITGLDDDEEKIRLARMQFGGRGATFWASRPDAMPFTNGQFDRVLSLISLQASPASPMRTVREMRRVARPGGTVAAAVWDLRGGILAHRMFWDTAAAIDAEGLFLRSRELNRAFGQPGELGAAFRAVGLEAVREANLMIRMSFTGFDDFFQPFCVPGGVAATFLDQLRDERRALFTQKLRLAYLDGERDGPRSYVAVAFAATGTAPATASLAVPAGANDPEPALPAMAQAPTAPKTETGATEAAAEAGGTEGALV